MKKTVTTSFVFVWLTSVLLAQSPLDNNGSRFTLGVFGGLSVPNLSGGNGNPLSSDYTSLLGEAFGLTADYSLPSCVGLCADALFSSEGGKRNGMQAFSASQVNPQAPAGTYFYADFNNESILSYVEIPVMAKYSIPVSAISKAYVDFGPYGGYLLHAEQETSGTSIIYENQAETIPVAPVVPQSFNASHDVTGSIKRTNFGLTGGVGFTQGVGFGAIFLDVRGAYGLTTVQKYSQDGSSHNGYLLLALGYSLFRG